MERKTEIKDLLESGHTLPEIRTLLGITLSDLVITLCDMHKAGLVDLVPWIERNVNAKTLFSATEYLTRVPNPTLAEGASALGIDINLMRFAEARIYKPV